MRLGRGVILSLADILRMPLAIPGRVVPVGVAADDVTALHDDGNLETPLCGNGLLPGAVSPSGVVHAEGVVAQAIAVGNGQSNQALAVRIGLPLARRMADHPVIVDHQRNLREVFGIQLGDPVEDFALDRLGILVDGRHVILVIGYAVALAPFPETVSVDEGCAVRVVELLGKGLDELLIILLEDGILRHRGLAVGVFRILQSILRTGIIDELGRIGSLIASVDHDTEGDGEVPFPGGLHQFVDLRIGIFPGILPVRRVQHRPLRADVAGRSVVGHLHVLAQRRHIDLRIEIGGVVIGADIHDPTVQRIVQHVAAIVGRFHGHSLNGFAAVARSVIGFRAAARRRAEKRQRHENRQ